MSYQHRQSPKQQLSDFARVFPRAAFVTAAAFLSMMLFFGASLGSLNLIQALPELGGTESLLPFLLVSWMSLCLYITALNMEGIDGDIEEEAEETAEEAVDVDSDEPLKEIWNASLKMHKALANLAHLVILITVGAVVSLYVTANFAPTFGILVAVALPMIEGKLTGTRVWFLSPSELLIIPAIIAIVPVTLGVVLLSFAIGMTLAVSQVLSTALKALVKWLVELFRISHIEMPALELFHKKFNHQRR